MIRILILATLLSSCSSFFLGNRDVVFVLHNDEIAGCIEMVNSHLSQVYISDIESRFLERLGPYYKLSHSKRFASNCSELSFPSACLYDKGSEFSYRYYSVVDSEISCVNSGGEWLNY